MDTDKHGFSFIEPSARIPASVFEIQNQTDLQPGDAQIIQHLATLDIGYPVNDLRVHNHRTKNDQVGDKYADLNTAKQNRKLSLLIKGRVILFKQNRQRALINFSTRAQFHSKLQKQSR